MTSDMHLTTGGPAWLGKELAHDQVLAETHHVLPYARYLPTDLQRSKLTDNYIRLHQALGYRRRRSFSPIMILIAHRLTCHDLAHCLVPSE